MFGSLRKLVSGGKENSPDPMASENAAAKRAEAFAVYRGEGVEKDLARASVLFRQAADLGDVEAQRQLGLMLERGEGSAANLAEARNWLRKAAERDDVEAMAQLGRTFAEGKPRDMKAAAKWFQRAAAKGHHIAEAFYAELLYEGNGVSKGVSEAMGWMARSAESGNLYAQVRMAEIHDEWILNDGRRHLSHFWRHKAGSNGHADSLLLSRLYVPADVPFPDSASEVPAWSARLLVCERQLGEWVAGRFDNQPFYPVPTKMYGFHHRNLNHREDLYGWWHECRKDFAKPPRDDTERRLREAFYWRAELNRHLVGSLPALAPKQAIIDAFLLIEKWHLRRYFMATGIVKQTWFNGEFIDAQFELEAAEKINRMSPGGSRIQRARGEVERLRQLKVQHDAQVGEWYFANVENAFKEAFERPKESDAGQQKAHGDARLATETEARNAALGKQTSRADIHDQEF